MEFGFVIKNAEDDYTVNVDLEAYASGYNVVSKDIDPYNQYDIEEVRAYCEANPQMVLAEHPYETARHLITEQTELKTYLLRTDYMVVKCSERGLPMASEYPTDYENRQKARERINEIDEILRGIFGGISNG